MIFKPQKSGQSTKLELRQIDSSQNRWGESWFNILSILSFVVWIQAITSNILKYWCQSLKLFNIPTLHCCLNSPYYQAHIIIIQHNFAPIWRVVPKRKAHLACKIRKKNCNSQIKVCFSESSFPIPISHFQHQPERKKSWLNIRTQITRIVLQSWKLKNVYRH